ncbi:hypothetical protein [Mycobacterium sp. AT1]|uniref:hypothetical protein n=1 Tax=Mycobacterium sp. AT1 TaxID=1961706 RepID=UPI0009D4CEC6|nr:hypothetical protein B1790_02665 [Mycobacterium sp. AT1]
MSTAINDEVLFEADHRTEAEAAPLRPWTVIAKDHFVRIRPSRVTGRRFAFGLDPVDRAPAS